MALLAVPYAARLDRARDTADILAHRRSVAARRQRRKAWRRFVGTSRPANWVRLLSCSAADTDWNSASGREVISLFESRVRLPGQCRRGPQPDAAARRALTPASGWSSLLAKAACSPPPRTTLRIAPTVKVRASSPGSTWSYGPTRSPRDRWTLETVETWLHDFLPPREVQFGGRRIGLLRRDGSCPRHGGVIARPCPRQQPGAGRHLPDPVGSGPRPLLAAYLLATVLLSYYATLGLTALFASYWAGKPLGEIEWRVPFFLFTILVAVGEDYNILMITRALKERKRHGAVEGMRRGLACTGGTITACGLIMAGTFAHADARRLEARWCRSASRLAWAC